MRVLLRQTKTRLYYAGPQGWTGDCNNAVDLEEVTKALALGHEAKLAGLEVVLSYEDPLCDLILPVQSGS